MHQLELSFPENNSGIFIKVPRVRGRGRPALKIQVHSLQPDLELQITSAPKKKQRPRRRAPKVNLEQSQDNPVDRIDWDEVARHLEAAERCHPDYEKRKREEEEREAEEQLHPEPLSPAAEALRKLYLRRPLE
jgi:hypothetical protein